MTQYKSTIYIILIISIIVSFSNCKKTIVQPTETCNIDFVDSSSSHPKATKYQNIIDKYTKKGIPGIVLLIQDSSGVWVGSSGKADIKRNIDMMPCTVSKIASITKLFIGALSVILADEGYFNLDDKISKYIPEKIIKKIENANECTVKQLLNHTSGIYDHVSDQGFYLKLLNNPDHNWNQEEILEYVYNKPAYFATESGIKYSNTNFVLLSMVIEAATGKSHSELLHSKILDPLNLKHTYYFWHDKLPEYTAQGYFDLYNNGNILNMSNYNTGSGNGYGGIYSTVSDMNIFLNALLVDKTLLTANQYNTLMTFTTTKEYDEVNESRYLGMGIFHQYFLGRNDDESAFGHGGRDLAYNADLYWFPKNNTRLSYIVNYGTNGKSTVTDAFNEFRKTVIAEIFDKNN